MLPLLLIFVIQYIHSLTAFANETSPRHVSTQILNSRSQSMSDMVNLAANAEPYSGFDEMSVQAFLSYRKNLEQAISRPDIGADLRDMYKQWLKDFDQSIIGDEDVAESDSPPQEDQRQLTEESHTVHFKVSANSEQISDETLKIVPEHIVSTTKSSEHDSQSTGRYIEILKSLPDLITIKKYSDVVYEDLESRTIELYENAGREMPIFGDISPELFDRSTDGRLQHTAAKNLTIPYVLLDIIVEDDSPEIEAISNELKMFMDATIPNSDDKNDIIASYNAAQQDSGHDETAYPFLFIEFVFSKLYYIDEPGLVALIDKMTSLKARLTLIKHNMGICNSILHEALTLRKRFGPGALSVFVKMNTLADQITRNFHSLEPIVMLLSVYSQPGMNEHLFDNDKEDKRLNDLMADILQIHLGPRKSDWIPGLQSLYEYLILKIPNEAPAIYIQRLILNELSRIFYTNLVPNCLRSDAPNIYDTFRAYGRFIVLLLSSHSRFEEITKASEAAHKCLKGFKEELIDKQDIIMKRTDKKFLEEWNLYFDKKVMKGRLTKKLIQCHKDFQVIFDKQYVLSQPLALIEHEVTKLMILDALKGSQSLITASDVHQSTVQSANEIVDIFNILSRKYRMF